MAQAYLGHLLLKLLPTNCGVVYNKGSGSGQNRMIFSDVFQWKYISRVEYRLAHGMFVYAYGAGLSHNSEFNPKSKATMSVDGR